MTWYRTTRFLGALALYLVLILVLLRAGGSMAVAQDGGNEAGTCGSLETGLPTSAAWPYRDDVEGPVELAPTSAFYVRTPQTWSDAVEQSRLVVHTRVAERTYEERVDPYRGYKYVVSHYTTEVLEYLKRPPGDSTADRTLSILRNDGVMLRDGATVIHYDELFPDYAPGCEYVMFLDWDDSLGGYYPTGGSYLTFLLDTDQQRVVSRSPLLRETGEAETPLTFLSLLRVLVGSSS